MRIVGVIPARYGSSRFQGKPLAMICGKPMIQRVYERASLVKRLDEVYVATDDVRIETCCKQKNIPVIMTSTEHRNGSERLSEVARKIIADIYVTIQGDEPLLEPSTIDKVIDTIMESDDIPCATLKTAFHNPVDVVNTTTPKVVTDLNDDILLFSRSAIPFPNGALDYIFYKAIGVYAFRRQTLLDYGDLSMGPIERAEGIELLRLVEHGYKVRIREVASDTVAVDTPKDLKRIEDFIRANPDLN